MAFLVSPGVQVNEIDLTNVVPAVATSIGAIAGAFEKGPVSTIVNISSEEELVEIFGKPTTRKYRRMAVALAYGNEETPILIEKAKKVASKIKID